MNGRTGNAGERETRPHVVIIGAYGSAGVAVAEGLTPHIGEEIGRLTLVDDGEPGGGLCILRGCMPSKEVLSAAQHRHQARSDERLDGEPPGMDLASIVDRKDDHVAAFARHRREAVRDLADHDGVEFHRGTAAFLDDRTILIDGTGEGDGEDTEGERDGEAGDNGTVIEADYVAIATGSVPNRPSIPGLEGVDPARLYTSADVLDATHLPDSGVVMGFGYVGLELVPYLAEAGVDLTVVEHDARPLDEADPAFGDALLSLYREEFGVRIVTGASEERIDQIDEGVRLGLDTGEAIEAEAAFLFTGRRPNLDALRLGNTTLSPESGWIDATMRPPGAERTFVVGDANEREPILHVAKEQGYHTAENILAHVRNEPLTPYRNVHHHVVFSGAGVYPFARVGHTEKSAQEAGYEIAVATRRAENDGVFETKDVPHGLARLVVDADDGTVLGYQGLHYHADVMAKTMQVIVELGLDVRELPDRAYHPTTPEILDGLFRETAAELGS
ncbi:dihydrolipoamide dehydrogenase [Halalkaliarchaeum desulfuricum]|uniref:Dihydrolipoamide dehydrogenase n=1 Tax=Halalkaliarchaeum desulfuricum TaxID=2055893 RepID=A0A343TJZ1_9EURY|nr:NAD(P)/FAD-dependent oxidoreductase [Halalkaliarchaeum desulfuricum]AUX09413.1 dihydrolipoamide dehydrogenase [Halalkaliarchaeum desulfuricum]